MQKVVGSNPISRLHVTDLVLRPLADDDARELLRIRSLPEVARWWDLPEGAFPYEAGPETVRWTIHVDGQVGGMVQYEEEPDPKYRSASVDIFLDPALHGRGIGTEALARIVRYLINELGHHRITIDPSTDNEIAIRSYERVGFRRVGVMREAERNFDEQGWHDRLLMELIAGEERQ